MASKSGIPIASNVAVLPGKKDELKVGDKVIIKKIFCNCQNWALILFQPIVV